jgi:16S rRNA (guanine(966)-N(2))-methyltransferase RsmD
VRVIAGTARGRKLETPTWDGLRPTSDRLREALFNILAPRVAGSRVLDGYAGTGAIGIEALSRGAAHVTFVERDPRALRLIRANLARTGLDAPADTCTIVRAAFAAMAASHEGPPFDLVLLDPPYDDRSLGEALLAAGGILRDDGLVVLEHATRVAAPEPDSGLARVRTVKAGDSSLTFYEVRS